MESSLRAFAFKMIGKKEKQSVGKTELSVGSCNSANSQMTGLSLVVCSMTLARQLQMYCHQSWSWNVKPGDHRVLPSRGNNEQCLQCLIGRAHWDNLVQCHVQLWRLEDTVCIESLRHMQWQWSRSCSRRYTGVSRPEWQINHLDTCSGNEVGHAADGIQVSADRNGR